jgi:hypothetical protein
MLDVRNSALGIGAQGSHTFQRERLKDDSATPDLNDNEETDNPTQSILPIDLSTGKASISLQDMISASLALKSNLDIEVINPSSQWPHAIYRSSAQSMHEGATNLPSHLDNQEIPDQIVQAISGLQREVLLLRNELNFELWLSRENVKHIGRLYQDRILAKSAEAERQGLVGLFFLKLRSLFADTIFYMTV